MATQPDAPIKGSWEDLLQNARQLAANYNDDAIPIYEKLVTRLSQMSSARRHAAGNRLQDILMLAAFELEQYYLMRERWDEALDLLDVLAAEGPDDEAQQWENLRVPIVLQAGRTDEAVELVRAEALEPDADLEDWHSLAMLQLKLKRLDDVEDTIEEMDAWIEARYGDEAPEARDRDLAIVELIRAAHAVDTRDWQEGLDRFQRAIELDPEQRTQLSGMYIKLLMYGRVEDAVTLIRRDQASRVRPNFWLGYAYRLNGDMERADEHWEKALSADMTKAENQQFLDWVLSSYYLNDAEGVGLRTVLRVLQEAENRHWTILVLAGLGWAIRNNSSSARTNLELAVLGCRAAVDGRLLPPELWIHFEALLPAQMQSRLIEFFDVDTYAADARGSGSDGLRSDVESAEAGAGE